MFAILVLVLQVVRVHRHSVYDRCRSTGPSCNWLTDSHVSLVSDTDESVSQPHPLTFMPSELERYVSDNALQVSTYILFPSLIRTHTLFEVLWPLGQKHRRLRNCVRCVYSLS